MKQETMVLMTDTEWEDVRDVARRVITMTGAEFQDDDTDYLVSFHLLHESGMLDLFGAIKSAYELGRRSQGDLLAAAIEALHEGRIHGHLKHTTATKLSDAIAKAEGRS